jgi:hypothetical protein
LTEGSSFEDKQCRRIEQVLNRISAVRRQIRVRKEDSAFIYFILEAQEGITAYSTLDFKSEDAHRDLLLMIPPDFVHEVDALLKELGDLIYVLPEESTR